MAKERLILASGSPRRRELLSRVGIEVEVVPASISEVAQDGESPGAFASRMAGEKARAIAGQRPGRWVLGADTVVAAGAGSTILGKPGNEAEARAMLGQLLGTSHEVITAFAIIGPGGETCERAARAEVIMRAAGPGEIDGYLAAGEWRGKAGGYAVQGMAAAFVAEVRGSVTAVIGLPLCEVCVALAELSCVRPDFRRGEPA